MLEQAVKKLGRNSPTPQLDAEILLVDILKKPRAWILAHPEYELTKPQIINYQLKIARRSHSEPIAYIVNYKDFYNLSFYVNRNVLIPRPETELIVEKSLTYIRQHLKQATIIELGTGSGCVTISLMKNLRFLSKNYHFYATDISKKALNIAKKNAQKYQLTDKLEFVQSNLLQNNKIQTVFKKQLSIVILANLPYLSKKLYATTKKNVKKFEPKVALLSGQDGLAHYRKLFRQLKLLITKYSAAITIFCEISPEQKSKMTKEILVNFPQAKIKFFKDLSNKWRLVKIMV